jgi:hypothetical protein
MLVGAPGSLGSQLQRSWGLLAGLVLATTLLTAFGVWLPRGDSVDNSAALAFAAGVYIAPQLAVPGLAAAWAIGVFASRRKLDGWRLLEQVSRRALLMAGTFAAVRATLQAFAGGATLSAVISPGSTPAASVPLALVALGGVAFVALDTTLEQLQSSSRQASPANSLFTGALQQRGSMLLAEMSVGILLVLIYPTLDVWGIAIATAMLLVMRRSFALLLEMQASYKATIEAFARALEESDPSRRGHAERVADLAAIAARRLGFRSGDVEDIRNAALFHDIGELGFDEDTAEPARRSSVVLADVRLLQGALPILSVLEMAGGVDGSLVERDVIGAYLVARLSDFDSSAHGKPSLSAAEAIGARLYVDTRAAVDRVILQVQATVEDTGQFSAATGEASA